MTQKNRQEQLFDNAVAFGEAVTFDGVISLNSTLQQSLVAAGSTLAITRALHDGKTILLDQATGSVVTLPAATGSGARFRLAVSVPVTSNDHILQVVGTDEFHGHMLQTDTDTTDTLASYPALAADNFDTVTLNGTTSGGLSGDQIEVEDIAAGVWLINGKINSNGVVVTPFSSVV